MESKKCVPIILLVIIAFVMFLLMILKNEKFGDVKSAELKRNPSFIGYSGTSQECVQAKDDKDLCGLVRYDNFSCKGADGCLAMPVVKEEGALPTQGNIGSILSYCEGEGYMNCSGNEYSFPLPVYDPRVASYTSGAGNITYPSGAGEIGGKMIGYRSMITGPDAPPNVPDYTTDVWWGLTYDNNTKLRTNCAAVDPMTGLRTCMTGQGCFTGNSPTEPNSPLTTNPLGCYNNFWPPIAKENDQCSLIPRYPQPPSKYMDNGVLQPQIQTPGPLTDVLSTSQCS